MDPDPDPGGQKSPDPGGSGFESRSGSSTLVITKGRGKGREERGRKGLKHREGSVNITGVSPAIQSASLKNCANQGQK